MQARRFWKDKRTNGTESVVFDKDRESILPQSMQISATLHAGHVEIEWGICMVLGGENRLSPSHMDCQESRNWRRRNGQPGMIRTEDRGPTASPLRSLGYIKFSAFCLVDQLARSRTSNLGSGDPGTRIEDSAASQEQIWYTMYGSKPKAELKTT
ncbi:hypothetical protein CISG_00328 [Coccidioides immitis RMSCC 3703]|uniref:Uncharacterized protein n=1 Tax=Coccidioides immitis RMSCC 3703 TaxID=454286 RepID=A0A0J8QI33_COCIT|nr:hypothetical protein CISG_00328 [Coccidioides immitis RMSCC 3703]